MACVDSEQSGYGTELSSIMKAIDEQSLVEPQKLKDYSWDMFIAAPAYIRKWIRQVWKGC